MCIMGILYYLIYLYSVYLEAFLKIDEENIVNLGDEKLNIIFYQCMDLSLVC